MRYRFADATDAADREARERVLSLAATLWEAAARGDRCSAGSIAREIDEDLSVSLGPGGVSLRAERRSLTPLVDLLAVSAPASLHVRTSAPAMALDDALAAVEREFGARLAQARVRVGVQRGHLLDVVVYSHDCAGHADEPALEAAGAVVEYLAGQRVFDDWVGDVGVAPLPRGAGLLRVHDSHARVETYPLGALSRLLGRAIDGIVDGLPAEPWHAVDARDEWTLFELDSREADPHAPLCDVVLAASVHPEMLKCHLEGAPFASCRFSRHGERFAVVVAAPGDESSGRLLERRDALEREVDAALRAARIGAVVGNAVGVAHVHVHLALADVQGAIEPLRAACARAGGATRAWLAFLDGEWADEWLALGAAVPAPRAWLPRGRHGPTHRP